MKVVIVKKDIKRGKTFTSLIGPLFLVPPRFPSKKNAFLIIYTADSSDFSLLAALISTENSKENFIFSLSTLIIV